MEVQGQREDRAQQREVSSLGGRELSGWAACRQWTPYTGRTVSNPLSVEVVELSAPERGGAQRKARVPCGERGGFVVLGEGGGSVSGIFGLRGLPQKCSSLGNLGSWAMISPSSKRCPAWHLPSLPTALSVSSGWPCTRGSCHITKAWLSGCPTRLRPHSWQAPAPGAKQMLAWWAPRWACSTLPPSLPRDARFAFLITASSEDLEWVRVGVSPGSQRTRLGLAGTGSFQQGAV